MVYTTDSILFTAFLIINHLILDFFPLWISGGKKEEFLHEK